MFGGLQLKEPAEIALGLHLVRFPDCINDMLVDMLPNRITEFLYDLSQKFTQFYTDCQVHTYHKNSSLMPAQELPTVVAALYT